MYGPSPPSFPHSAPTHVNPRCDDVTNLTVDGVKRFTPAVRHIHVKISLVNAPNKTHSVNNTSQRDTLYIHLGVIFAVTTCTPGASNTSVLLLLFMASCTGCRSVAVLTHSSDATRVQDFHSRTVHLKIRG